MFAWLRRLFARSTSEVSWRDKGYLSVPNEAAEEYYDACFRYGPDSPQTKAVRGKHAAVPYFLELADDADKLKKDVGGSGVDYPPDQPSQ